MLTKIYAALCVIFVLAAGVLFLTGYFTILAAVVFGLIAFGMVFMGMMAVLPYDVSHPRPKKMEPVSEVAIRSNSGGFVEQAREFAKEMLSSDGVEIRNPKYR